MMPRSRATLDQRPAAKSHRYEWQPTYVYSAPTRPVSRNPKYCG
jgi:hypothetical protein